jgi:hypothetical protein
VQLEAVLASKTTDAQWQLLPTSLASDGNIQFEVTAQGSLALPTVTLPQTFVIPLYSTGDGPLMEAHYTELLSAQVIDEDAINTTNASPGYAYYPFYLADEFGWLREILEDVITVAGVHVNLSDLYYDDAGPHIL